MTTPYISVVIPVHNEQEVLPTLAKRLYKVLDDIGKPFEVIFTNDGSKDNTEAELLKIRAQRPTQTRIIHFNGNFGQHMAIMAGFERVRGEIVVTLDADCQNPPEDIPKLIAKIEEGHDVVGGYRENRQDSAWRLIVSKLHNIIRAKITPNIIMKDEGCMLRAFKRNIVDLMVMSGEATTFIPALALTFAANPAEVPVRHEARTQGTTSYNFYKLIRYNFDLVTGFSLVPLELFTLVGIITSVVSGLLMTYMVARRFIIGPEAELMYTLGPIFLFLMGLILLGLGILGEYIGRIYLEVLKRPRFVIKEDLAPTHSSAASSSPIPSSKETATTVE